VFGDRTSFTEARLSREELQELVEEAAKTGSLDAPSSEIAARAIGFGGVRVGELMVPRSEMVALPRKAPPSEVQRVLLEQGHSRMPVYDESMDRIVGYIVAKDILALTWQTELIILEDILRPVHFVKHSAKAADVMRELQRRRLQLAIVMDDQDAVAGIVTMEDLVEELVGEIFSEDERERIRPQPDGSILIQGSVPVREVNRELEISLPEGESWTTVAGLTAVRASSIPRPGWKTTFDDGTQLEVVDASPRKVELIRLRKPA
jgi:putative hemolysin